jgi:hypothetical protein
LTKLEALDKICENQADNTQVWEERYRLEAGLKIIYEKEEIYWQ